MIALKRLSRFCLLRALGNQPKFSTYSTTRMCKAQITAEEVRSLADALKNGLRALGQPTNATHPHLIKPHELVPGVEQAEFQTRRIRLMEGIQTYAEGFGNEFNGRASRAHMVRLDIYPDALIFTSYIYPSAGHWSRLQKVYERQDTLCVSSKFGLLLSNRLFRAGLGASTDY